MRVTAAGATAVAATIALAVARYAVVPARRLATFGAALTVGCARTAKPNAPRASTWSRAAYRSTYAASTFESTATLRSTRAGPAIKPAAVQRAITGNTIVRARDGAARLAAVASRGALASETDRAATTLAAPAHTVGARQPSTAVAILRTAPACIATTVQRPVGIEAVRCARRGA